MASSSRKFNDRYNAFLQTRPPKHNDLSVQLLQLLLYGTLFAIVFLFALLVIVDWQSVLAFLGE
ncbi:MAG: hypothetical protein PVF74_09785 [Anaerolineales bacterium]